MPPVIKPVEMRVAVCTAGCKHGQSVAAAGMKAQCLKKDRKLIGLDYH
jgi:hypothetical protein